MAELTASIIGIISAGSKVALILSAVASDVGSAGKEAQVVAREIRSFCAVLRSITKTVDQVIGHADQMEHCRDVISDMTDVSREMFTEILNLVEELQKAAWGGRSANHSPENDFSPKLNLGRRIRWVFNKPQLSFLRSAIEAYKADLTLALGTMQLARGLEIGSDQAAASPATTYQHERANRDLEDLVSDYQASLTDLEAARKALSNTDEQEPHAVLESEGIKATERDQQLWAAIQNVRSEVNSLHSGTSRVNSMATSSIYDSISRNNIRLSLLAENLPLADTPVMQDFRRLSQKTPIQRSSLLNSVQKGRRSPSPGRAFQDMERWSLASRASLAGVSVAMAGQLRTSLHLLDESEYRRLLSWVGYVTQDLSTYPPGPAQLRYLAQLSDKARGVEEITVAVSPYLIAATSSAPRPKHRSSSPARSPLPIRQSPSARSSPNNSDQTIRTPPPRPPRSPVPKVTFGSSDEDTVAEFKSFRVAMDVPCHQAIPAALKKFAVKSHWQKYALFVVYGDVERQVGPEEKPLVIQEELVREGKRPFFMLRRIAEPRQGSGF